MRVLIVVALLLGAGGLALGVASIVEEDDKESEELALTLTVQEGDFKVNDVAPAATSEEDISSGDSFVFTGAVSGDREGKLLGACEVADVGERPNRALRAGRGSRPRGAPRDSGGLHGLTSGLLSRAAL